MECRRLVRSRQASKRSARTCLRRQQPPPQPHPPRECAPVPISHSHSRNKLGLSNLNNNSTSSPCLLAHQCNNNRNRNRNRNRSTRHRMHRCSQRFPCKPRRTHRRYRRSRTTMPPFLTSAVMVRGAPRLLLQAHSALACSPFIVHRACCRHLSRGRTDGPRQCAARLHSAAATGRLSALPEHGLAAESAAVSLMHTHTFVLPLAPSPRLAMPTCQCCCTLSFQPV